MKPSGTDSGKVINLSKRRKQQTKEDKKKRAAENRIKHGRTGAQKQADRLEKARQSKAHDDKKMTDK